MTSECLLSLDILCGHWSPRCREAPRQSALAKPELETWPHLPLFTHAQADKELITQGRPCPLSNDCAGYTMLSLSSHDVAPWSLPAPGTPGACRVPHGAGCGGCTQLRLQPVPKLAISTQGVKCPGLVWDCLVLCVSRLGRSLAIPVFIYVICYILNISWAPFWTGATLGLGTQSPIEHDLCSQELPVCRGGRCRNNFRAKGVWGSVAEHVPRMLRAWV